MKRGRACVLEQRCLLGLIWYNSPKHFYRMDSTVKRKWRAKQKADPFLYEQMKESDRERKKKSRQKLKERLQFSPYQTKRKLSEKKV